MQKKICFIAPDAYPLFNPEVRANFGGSELQLVLLAKELAKKENFKVFFIVLDHGQPDEEVRGKIVIRKCFKEGDNIIYRIFKFLKAIFYSETDVYVFRALNVYLPFINAFLKIRRKKVVYMVAHDSEVDFSHKLHGYKFGKFLIRYFFRSVSIITVQSEYQRDTLKNKFKVQSNILKNGYSRPILERSKEIRKEGHILWVGRGERWKRPELFIKLAKEAPDGRFVMICPPASNEEVFFKRIAIQARQVDNLTFFSGVRFDKINKYFGECSCFVNTSDKEGFPNTFVQAVALGVPIISVSVNPDNFIVENRCGFFLENNHEKMATALGILLKDKNIYDELSANALKYYFKNHSLERISEEFIRIIQK